MTTDQTELLTACLDGEPVDPRELSALLSDPGARELLCDLAILRAASGNADDSPSTVFYERMELLLKPTPRTRARWPAWRLPAAAAALVLAMLGGWGLHVLVPGPPPSLETVESSVAGEPPEATRVVRLENDVDWRQ